MFIIVEKMYKSTGIKVESTTRLGGFQGCSFIESVLLSAIYELKEKKL